MGRAELSDNIITVNCLYCSLSSSTLLHHTYYARDVEQLYPVTYHCGVHTTGLWKSCHNKLWRLLHCGACCILCICHGTLVCLWHFPATCISQTEMLMYRVVNAFVALCCKPTTGGTSKLSDTCGGLQYIVCVLQASSSQALWRLEHCLVGKALMCC